VFTSEVSKHHSHQCTKIFTIHKQLKCITYWVYFDVVGHFVHVLLTDYKSAGYTTGVGLHPDSRVAYRGLSDPKCLFNPSGLSLYDQPLLRCPRLRGSLLQHGLWMMADLWVTLLSLDPEAQVCVPTVASQVVINQRNVNKMSDRHWNVVSRWYIAVSYVQ